ncbi:hypothetical protein [Flavobacterium sp.]|uniref:hypothetical protein n=1 Tax=Flavobacterium sp. TaxID=239 RepID=UPI0040487FCD
MKKSHAFIIIVIISILLSSIYGIIHDQITFTISEEYYTKFKFIQFGLNNWNIGQDIGTISSPELKLYNPRLGVTIVGVIATWWVGLLTGLLLGLVGLIHENGKKMLFITLKAILITTGIALVIGLMGLLFGKLFLTTSTPNWYFPNKLIHKDRFIMVGSMHNFSYIGGLIGLIISIRFSFKQKGKLEMNT